jgi:hypothetical protein
MQALWHVAAGVQAYMPLQRSWPAGEIQLSVEAAIPVYTLLATTARALRQDIAECTTSDYPAACCAVAVAPDTYLDHPVPCMLRDAVST